jgi:hypothetical protein
MSLISRRLFEHHPSAHLNRIKSGLAACLRRKVGDAWRPIVDEMYRVHGDEMMVADLAAERKRSRRSNTKVMRRLLQV